MENHLMLSAVQRKPLHERVTQNECLDFTATELK